MRRFVKADIPIVNAWYELRGMPALHQHLFPDIGFIVEGVGAGFLYCTDSSLCFLDGYVSSPNSTKSQRNDAFDKISNALILIAKEFGFSQVLAYTDNSAIRKRCERFRFERKGDYTLYVRHI